MKNKITVTFFVFTMTLQFALSQTPTVEWAKCYGGTDGEVARCIRQTKDGGYIAVGNAGSNDADVYKNEGSEDCWIVKLNKFGDTVWTRVLGGSQLDFAMTVRQTEDGGYIVGAQSSSANGDFVGGSSGSYDCWIIKLDANGVVLWKKRFGGSGDDSPRDIILTVDSGFVIAGSSSSKNGGVWGNHGKLDYWILRLNKAGDTLWSKSYGGSGNDQAFSIYQTTDNAYVLVGQSDSKNGDVRNNHGGTDYWILKINNKGDTLWTKTLGGKENDLGHNILQTSDGGFIVGGSSQSNNGNVTGHHGDSTKADIWIVKLDSGRNIQWQKSYGGSHNEAMYGTLLAFSMLQTTEGGYLVASYTSSNDGDVSANNGASDVWLLKLTDSGNLTWQKSLGGTYNDYAYSIRQTTDGGFVVSAMAGPNSGDVAGNHGGADFWVIKFLGTSNLVGKNINSDLMIYPNPASNTLEVNHAPIGARLKIADITGKIIFSTIMVQEKIIIPLNDFVGGMYMLQIEKNGDKARQKIIVQK